MNDEIEILKRENEILRKENEAMRNRMQEKRYEVADEMLQWLKNKIAQHESYTIDKEDIQAYATACRDWHHVAYSITKKLFEDFVVAFCMHKKKKNWKKSE